eukprot:COSAG05_NODE_171_length_15032_cov_41.734561_9_plen_171_part_00
MTELGLKPGNKSAKQMAQALSSHQTATVEDLKRRIDSGELQGDKKDLYSKRALYDSEQQPSEPQSDPGSQDEEAEAQSPLTQVLTLFMGNQTLAFAGQQAQQQGANTAEEVLRTASQILSTNPTESTLDDMDELQDIASNTCSLLPMADESQFPPYIPHTVVWGKATEGR